MKEDSLKFEEQSMFEEWLMTLTNEELNDYYADYYLACNTEL